MLVADFRDSQTTAARLTRSTEIATFVESLLTSDRNSTESHG